MGRLLVPRERKGNQSLEALIIVQRIERYKTLSENSIRIPSRWSADKVQDLGRHLLRKDCYCVVELRFTDCNTADRKLLVRLRESNFGCLRPGNRQLHRHIFYRRK